LKIPTSPPEKRVYPVADFLTSSGYAPFQFASDCLVPFRFRHDSARQVFGLLFAVPKRLGKSYFSSTDNAVESAGAPNPTKSRFAITFGSYYVP
jgi:hypothetical protein